MTEKIPFQAPDSFSVSYEGREEPIGYRQVAVVDAESRTIRVPVRHEVLSTVHARTRGLGQHATRNLVVRPRS